MASYSNNNMEAAYSFFDVYSARSETLSSEGLHFPQNDNKCYGNLVRVEDLRAKFSSNKTYHF